MKNTLSDLNEGGADMMMIEETRNLLNAKKAFEKRGHKATLVQNTDRTRTKGAEGSD